MNENTYKLCIMTIDTSTYEMTYHNQLLIYAGFRCSLQNSVKNVTTDNAFRNWWARVFSLYSTLKNRYKLEQLNVLITLISRALGQLDPNLDDLTCCHQSGIYKGKYTQEYYWCFQYDDKAPPKFPQTRNNKHIWDKINDVD